MSLMMSPTTVVLWQDLIRHAENKLAISLEEDLEAYLISLLIRYSKQPEMAKQLIATAYLEAFQMREAERALSLQRVGDHCLLFAGLFPQISEKRRVRISYFVDLGQNAYAAISKKTDDLYGSLALEFVVLMDVLQSIRPNSTLLPLEAYEQWNEVGSQRALKMLQEYTKAIPHKSNKQ